MKLPLKVVLLMALSVAQVGAAAWSIVRYETTLAWGTPYKIRSIPVDPSDPFRGRYVAIAPGITLSPPVSPETERVLDSIGTRRGGGRESGVGTAYVVLAADPEGFARAVAIVADPPASGDFLEIAHLQKRIVAVAEQGRPAEVAHDLVLPFDRYYMSESAAPAAEERYREAVRRNAGSQAWITIRVRNGRGVVEGLFLDGVPIEQAP